MRRDDATNRDDFTSADSNHHQSLTPKQEKPEIKNLMQGLLEQMNRVRRVIAEYERLPDGAGRLAIAFMKLDIHKAEQAIAQGDVVQMLVCYTALKDTEPNIK